MRLRGARLGSLIGAVGGLAFVEINAAGLPGSAAVRIVGLLVFVVAVVGVLRAPEREDGGLVGWLRSSWLRGAVLVAGFVVGGGAIVVGSGDAAGWIGVAAGFVLLAASLSVVVTERSGGVGSPYARG